MLFKISCCAFCFPGLDFDEKLKLVANMGFDTVDLSAKAGDELSQEMIVEHPLQYGRLVRDKVIEYKLMLDELFICTILQNGEDMDITTADEDARELMVSKFTQFCAFAQEAGFVSVMLVPLAPNKDLDTETAWDNTVIMLRRFTAIAKSHNLIFNIEPVDFSLLKTPSLACKMAEAVPGMGFTLDYSHYVSVGFTEEEIAPMHRYLNHMHIRQAKLDSRQEPIETGTIDFRGVAQRLLDDDFSGNIAMEYMDVIEPWKLVNSPVRQVAELAARIKFVAKHELTK